jgi:hypothetical protein
MTLPNGKTLGMARVALSPAAMQAGLDGTDGGAESGMGADGVTKQNQALDQQMLAAFTKMAADFGQTVSAGNTTLEGTAAVDLSL